jgi:hypothetical protein
MAPLGAAAAAVLATPELAVALVVAAGPACASRLGLSGRAPGQRVREALPASGRRLLQLAVAGGEGPDGASRSSCERLRHGAPAWQPLPPAPSQRAGCAVAALEGCLYVVGGDGSDFETLSTADRLEPGPGGRLSTWVSLAPMRKRRTECAAVAFGGELLVVGGRDDAYVSLSSGEAPPHAAPRVC